MHDPPVRKPQHPPAAMVRLLVLGMGILLQFCRAAIYTNDWAMRITGGRDSVHGIAEKYGFTNMGQVSVIRHGDKHTTKDTQAFAVSSSIQKKGCSDCRPVPQHA